MTDEPDAKNDEKDATAKQGESGARHIKRDGHVEELSLGHAVEQAREHDSAGHRKQPAQKRDCAAFDEKQSDNRARSCAKGADNPDLPGALQHAENDGRDQRDRADERGGERDHFHNARHDGEMFLERRAEFASGVNEARRQPRVEKRLLQCTSDSSGASPWVFTRKRPAASPRPVIFRRRGKLRR